MSPFARINVLITPSSFGECGSEPFDLLRRAGLNFKLNPFKRKLTENEVIELATNCHGVVAGVEQYSEKVLRKLPLLKVISRCGVGMDSIDLSKARELGISVLNTPDGPTEAVAELTLALILNILRCVNNADRQLKQRVWKKYNGRLLSGKTVGLVGFGRIGRRVAQLLHPFKTHLLFFDPNVSSSEHSEYKVEKVQELDQLLVKSDIISFHLHWEKSHGYLIGEKELAAIKSDAFLINVARGGVIDERALCRKLLDGGLGGAAIDVFEAEPYTGELVQFENVLLTPHMGSYAQESRLKMETDAVLNLINAFVEK